MARNKILLRKLPRPKLVKVPNSRTFYAKYQRANRDTLYPTKVRIRRANVRKIGLRRQRKRRQAQAGSGYVDSDILKGGLNLAKKGANTEFGKTIIDDAVGLLPRAYKSIKKRVFGRKKRKQHHR